MTAVPTPEEIEAILGQLLFPNNEAIKIAEARLKEFSKLPSSTPALLERARTSTLPQVNCPKDVNVMICSCLFVYLRTANK
jgi:hypothetical protein